MMVYLVEDCGHCPGRIIAVCADKVDAEQFAIDMADRYEYPFQVIERNVIQGQPKMGYNR